MELTQALSRATPEEFEKAALFLLAGSSSALFRHENALQTEGI